VDTENQIQAPMAGQTSSIRSRLYATGRVVAVLGFFVLVTVILLWPWLAHLSSALIGPSEDNLQDFWDSWYAAVAADPKHFFYTNLIRFPEGALLNYHSFAYPQIFVLTLLAKLFGTDHGTLVALQNLTLLSSFPLAGVGAFYLVRHFTHHTAASLVGGIIFAFNPSHVVHVMHHAHVSQIEFIPFFVLAYLVALEKKSPPWLAAAVVFYALSALSCWYYLFYIAYFIVFHAIYSYLRDGKPLAGWQLRAPITCMLGTVVLLSPLLLPMFAQAGMQSGHPGGASRYVADIEAFFTFSTTHPFWQWSQSFYARADGNPWEATVYLGLANIALLVWLYLRTRRLNDPLTNYVLWGMAVFCVIAGGDTLHAFGYDLFVPLPGIALSHLPLLENVRTPSRIIVLVYLLLSIGIGHALAIAAREWRGRWAKPALGGIAALILFDFYPVQLATTSVSCPEGLDIIKNDPERGFGVLNLPRQYAEADTAMFQQTCHARPVAQASVSRILLPSLIDRLETKDLAAQRMQLKRAHVKYIVLDERISWVDNVPVKVKPILTKHFPWLWIPPAAAKLQDGPKESYLRTYRTVFRSPDLTILRVY
jgi:hypothetical protein